MEKTVEPTSPESKKDQLLKTKLLVDDYCVELKKEAK